MKRKIVMTFYDQNGNVVDRLLKVSADVNSIMAALTFIQPGDEIRLSCCEVEA